MFVGVAGFAMAAGTAPAAVVVGAPAAIVGAGAAAGARVGVVATKRATSLVRSGGTSLKFNEAVIGRVQQDSGISNENKIKRTRYEQGPWAMIT